MTTKFPPKVAEALSEAPGGSGRGLERETGGPKTLERQAGKMGKLASGRHAHSKWF